MSYVEFIEGDGEIVNFTLTSSVTQLRHAAILLIKEVSNFDVFVLSLEIVSRARSVLLLKGAA